MTNQPGGRYWIFEWEEFALYGAIALLIGAFCAWWYAVAGSADLRTRAPGGSARLGSAPEPGGASRVDVNR